MGRASWLPCSVVLAALMLLGRGSVALAQPELPDPGAQPGEALGATALFVHPSQGSDRAAGGEAAPLKTITQALAIATPGTTIYLAPGRYSPKSGEQFPLQIPDGVRLEGNSAGYGDGVVIHGGGAFVSSTGRQQNATAIASGSAVINGLTLSNDSGHGLWIEQGAPTVSNCLFWGSRQSGIAIRGSSSPTIRHNRFYQNQGEGLSVLGTATPLVQLNRIEETGYGLTVGEQAHPRLLQNHISGNRAGVVVQGQARPILRDNHIVQNQHDGVVTIAQAQPDLGTQGQPGRNQFRGNGQYAINAQASAQIITAAGNEFLTGLPTERTAGRVDFNGAVADAPLSRRSLASAAPSSSTPPAVTPPAVTPPATPPPAPAPRATQPSAGERPAVARRVPVQQNAALPNPPQSRPQRSANLLPVPAARVPIGHVGGRATIAASGGISYLQPRYRVVVVADSAQAQNQVRAIAPGAFITRVNGRAVMQAGAYQRSENAGQMQRQLASRGLRAEVQQIR